MIDLHVHLLPAIDDGATSTEETGAMLARARELGFTVLVATPHLPGPLTPAFQERVESAFAKTRLMGAKVGVDVRLGYEVELSLDLPARLERGEPSTLGGSNSVLVDLPLAGWPHHAEQTLFEVQTAGFRPVLAHVERYTEVQRDPRRALRLAERSVVLQVTIGSLVGLFGRAAQRTAEHLLRQGAIHLVATDAHSVGLRLAAVPDGSRRLGQVTNDETVARLLAESPRSVLEGMPLPELPAPSSLRWPARLAYLDDLLRPASGWRLLGPGDLVRRGGWKDRPVR